MLGTRNKRLLGTCGALLLGSLCLASSSLAVTRFQRPSPVAPPQPLTWHFKDYPSFKRQILALISASRRLVWVATRNLGDGDVVTALALAHYRRLQVYTLLHRDELYPNSQAAQLQGHHLPLAYAAAPLFADAPTYLWVDRGLFFISASLSPEPRLANYRIQAASAAYARAFADRFREPFRAGQFQAQARPPVASPPPAPAEPIPSDQGGIARALPKVTKWQKD